MFRYITVKEAARKREISERGIQKLCEEGRINGLQRFGSLWMIPEDAKKDDLRKRKNVQCKKVVKDHVQSSA